MCVLSILRVPGRHRRALPPWPSGAYSRNGLFDRRSSHRCGEDIAGPPHPAHPRLKPVRSERRSAYDRARERGSSHSGDARGRRRPSDRLRAVKPRDPRGTRARDTRLGHQARSTARAGRGQARGSWVRWMRSRRSRQSPRLSPRARTMAIEVRPARADQTPWCSPRSECRVPLRQELQKLGLST